MHRLAASMRYTCQTVLLLSGCPLIVASMQTAGSRSREAIM